MQPLCVPVITDGVVYEDYTISTDGKVVKVSTKEEIKPILKTYLAVRLTQKGIRKQFMLHRLVAFAFIHNDDPKTKTQVNHKNGDKLDNRIENLEWVSRKENIQHAFKTGLVDIQKKSGNDIQYDGQDEREECEVVDGHPNFKVFRDGRILNTRTKRFMKPQMRKKYPTVYLLNKTLVVHLIVAKAFVPNDNPDEKTQVNHIDGNTRNYNSGNLEWVTPSQNVKHAHDTGLTKCATRKVDQYDENGRFIKTFESLREAAKEVGCAWQNIQNVCKGKKPTARGYMWEYA